MAQQTIILMARREDPFSRVPKTTLRDARISWKAKGILSYLIGQPLDWKVRVQDLVNNSTDGPTAIRSALNELRDAGYAMLDKMKDESGKIVEWVWKVSDSPIFKPDAENPDVANAHVENQYLTKTDCTKTEITKKSPPSAGGICKSQLQEKAAELKKVRMPKDRPSRKEFEAFLEENDLEHVINFRPDLYEELELAKWHCWYSVSKWWLPIRDWQSYVAALNDTIAERRES